MYLPAGHDGLPDRFPRSGKKTNLSVLRALVVHIFFLKPDAKYAKNYLKEEQAKYIKRQESGGAQLPTSDFRSLTSDAQYLTERK